MAILYQNYPELELRMFSPAEVGILTGVSPDRQRQYRHNGIAKFIEPRDGQTKHSRFDWREVVLWGLFQEIVNYGFDLQSAGFFAAGLSDLSADQIGVAEIEHRPNSQILEYDFRETGDRMALFIFCYPQVGKPETFMRAATGNGRIVFDGRMSISGSGRFGFWVNYSDFQRRLLLRYESIQE